MDIEHIEKQNLAGLSVEERDYWTNRFVPLPSEEQVYMFFRNKGLTKRGEGAADFIKRVGRLLKPRKRQGRRAAQKRWMVRA